MKPYKTMDIVYGLKSWNQSLNQGYKQFHDNFQVKSLFMVSCYLFKEIRENYCS